MDPLVGLGWPVRPFYSPDLTTFKFALSLSQNKISPAEQGLGRYVFQT